MLNEVLVFLHSPKLWCYVNFSKVKMQVTLQTSLDDTVVCVVDITLSYIYPLTYSPVLLLFSHLLYLCRMMLQFIDMLLEFYILAFLFIQLCLHCAHLLLWCKRHSKLEHPSSSYSHMPYGSLCILNIKTSTTFFFYDSNQQKTEHSKINWYLK